MVESMLREDESILFCVFVGEIGSLLGKRQCSRSSHEPQDSLRVCIELVYTFVPNSSCCSLRPSMHF